MSRRQRPPSVSPDETWIPCPNECVGGEVAVRDLTRGWAVESATCPTCDGLGLVLERGAA